MHLHLQFTLLCDCTKWIRDVSALHWSPVTGFCPFRGSFNYTSCCYKLSMRYEMSCMYCLTHNTDIQRGGHFVFVAVLIVMPTNVINENNWWICHSPVSYFADVFFLCLSLLPNFFWIFYFVLHSPCRGNSCHQLSHMSAGRKSGVHHMWSKGFAWTHSQFHQEQWSISNERLPILQHNWQSINIFHGQ